MKSIKQFVGAVLGLWTMVAAGMAATDTPLEVLRTTADQVLSQVTANKVKLDQNPKGIYLLVEQTVVPRFDFTTMTQAALGRFWRRATPDQQAQVTNEFKELLVRTYAVALLGYSGQQIEYLPVRLTAGETDVMIPEVSVMP